MCPEEQTGRKVLLRNTHFQGKGESSVQEQLITVLQILRKKEMHLLMFPEDMSVVIGCMPRGYTYEFWSQKAGVSNIQAVPLISYWHVT